MMSVNQNIGIDKVNLAGLAVFVEGDLVLNTDIKNKLVALAEKKDTFTKVDFESFHIVDNETVNYFSYGSNMDLNQIKKRCPSARKIGIGKIKEYDIVFNRKGSYREGGVSSIQKSTKSEVYGMVFEMSATDLKKLDEIEDPNAYVREEINVNVMNVGVFKCNVYVAIPEKPIEADQEYLDIIINAAIKADLPIKYIERLKEYKIAQNKA